MGLICNCNTAPPFLHTAGTEGRYDRPGSCAARGLAAAATASYAGDSAVRPAPEWEPSDGPVVVHHGMLESARVRRRIAHPAGFLTPQLLVGTGSTGEDAVHAVIGRIQGKRR